MLHRIKKKNDINKDKWIGVGGKIEDGETPRDCVIREAREETGLRLKSPEYRGIIHFESDGNYSEEMLSILGSRALPMFPPSQTV